MNYEELAKKLNGTIEYNEVTPELEELARQNNLVIVFGYSDDNTELRGAIYDELSTVYGGEFHVNKHGLKYNACDNEDCPNFRITKDDKKTEAVWSDSGEWAWSYNTEIPHATFEIMTDEGQPWCLGMVFSLDDLG